MVHFSTATWYTFTPAFTDTHTISLFGVQGGGKSYTLGAIIEMACMQISQINLLPKPLSTVVFHYSSTQDYAPEFTSMNTPNSVQSQVELLAGHYGALPQFLSDILILTPSDKVEERESEFPDIDVAPILFNPRELQGSHWRFLMGAVGNQSMYLKQVNRILRDIRSDLSISSIRTAISSSNMSDHLKDLAQSRLALADHYVSDDHQLGDLFRPGRLVIVDLRDEYIEKDEALGLFAVILQVVSEATYQDVSFNKLVVFDEAHKYTNNPDLIAGLVEVVREMRHKGTSILVASQDPPSVPVSLIELSSEIILHRFNSPGWLKHIQRANSSLTNLNAQRMGELKPGEAYVWSSKSTEEAVTRSAIKIRCRPRVTQHGGSTKRAID